MTATAGSTGYTVGKQYGGCGLAEEVGAGRPAWLTHPTDAAGVRRPAGPFRLELFNAVAARAEGGASASSASSSFDPATLHVPPDALKNLPPLTRQFWGIKSRLMDCVVMYRHGSFYNMFDVDSEVGMGVGLRVSGKPAAFMQKVGCHDFDAW